MGQINRKDYKNFLESIKQQVYQSQYEALKQVNKELIGLYWFIGRTIIEKQVQFGWGRAIVKNLSEDLQKEFPGI